MNGPEISWQAFVSNEPLMVAGFGWCIAAVIKLLITFISDRKLVLVRMLGTGGMPSTHTAAVLSFTTCVGILYGLNHPYFGTSMLLAVIVMYDATNLRQEAGKHAEAINILLDELTKRGRIRKHKWTRMQELLGHTYIEVAVGGTIGILAAILGHQIWIHYIRIEQFGLPL